MAKFELSKYKVWWAEFKPTTGRYVAKRDQYTLGAITYTRRLKTFRKHFGSKEVAVKYLTSFDKYLDKHYEVRLFTDAQFAAAKEETGYAIPYTKKQLNEVYYI